MTVTDGVEGMPHCFGYGYLAMDVTNEFGEAFSMKGSKKIHENSNRPLEHTLDTVKKYTT